MDKTKKMSTENGPIMEHIWSKIYKFQMQTVTSRIKRNSN